MLNLRTTISFSILHHVIHTIAKKLSHLVTPFVLIVFVRMMNLLRIEDLYDWLRERGYKHKVVEDQIKRACNFDRNELLTKGKPARKQVLSLNIEYNPAFGKLSAVLKELDCILQGDEEHRKIFNDTSLVGFSNGKSLKNLLVRAVLPLSLIHISEPTRPY